MRFLIDAQLPPTMARWISVGEHSAEHVESVGLRDAPDSAIWAYALRTGAVIITKDEDFSARSTRVADAPVIVWLRLGNSTNATLRVWLEPRLSGMIDLIESGHRLVEVI